MNGANGVFATSKDKRKPPIHACPRSSCGRSRVKMDGGRAWVCPKDCPHATNDVVAAPVPDRSKSDLSVVK